MKTPMIGSKEIFCEEYIPYFLSNGVKVILLIRDPRDIITSLNFGKGADFTGEIRPTLFNIRNWVIKKAQLLPLIIEITKIYCASSMKI